MQKLPIPRCFECSRLHVRCDRNKLKCGSCSRSSRLCVWDDAQDDTGYAMNVDYCSKLTDKDFEFGIFTNYHTTVRQLKLTSSILSRFLGSPVIRARNLRQPSQISPIDWRPWITAFNKQWWTNWITSGFSKCITALVEGRLQAREDVDALQLFQHPSVP